MPYTPGIRDTSAASRAAGNQQAWQVVAYLLGNIGKTNAQNAPPAGTTYDPVRDQSVAPGFGSFWNAPKANTELLQTGGYRPLNVPSAQPQSY